MEQDWDMISSYPKTLTEVCLEKNSYYNQNNMECYDAIEGMIGKKGLEDFCRGNILKYVWRYKDKNGVEDLKKAKAYLDKLISIQD